MAFPSRCQSWLKTRGDILRAVWRTEEELLAEQLGEGQSLSWGGRGSPLHVYLSAFFPCWSLAISSAGDSGAGQGEGEGPLSPCCHLGLKGGRAE